MEPRPLWDEGTKRRLIMAGGEVFAQHGFRAATIREICKRAGASISAVNYHFRDKEGLYEAVFEYSHRWAVEKYPHDLGLGDRATPEERLRSFVLSFLLRGLGDGFPAWHGKLLAQETADPQGVLRKVAETAIRPMDEYLEGIVRELFHKEDPSQALDDHSVQLCRMERRHIWPGIWPNLGIAQELFLWSHGLQVLSGTSSREHQSTTSSPLLEPSP